MELIKQKLVEFQYKDVTFFVKTRASEGDSFSVKNTNVGSLIVKEGKLIREADMVLWGKLLVRLFVVKWKGVTEEGKEVPYSYDVFESSFPADEEDVLWNKIVNFIISNVDIFSKAAAILKNGSRALPIGSPESEASPASVATV